MADQESVSSFSFQALGLGSVLKLNRLSVPLYQREYAWKEEKVEQLLRDLQRAKDDQTDYFLGTIVTIPKPNTEVLNRSEEHTSELQSLMRISYAVFCLKNTKTPHQHAIH